MSLVGMSMNNNAEYPDKPWNPSVSYPEYSFGDCIAPTRNDAYDMVRQCLHALGLDESNYATPAWNPLGDYVKPGQTVVVKPNWVLHVNKGCAEDDRGMDCLVTHPSIIRAICDYCIIALKGEGRVIVGDAPVQDCDYDALMDAMEYRELLAFYRSRGVSLVEFEDFRAYRTRVNKMRVICDKQPNADGVEIDLGSLSAQRDDLDGRFVQVANYDRRVTTAFHSRGKHVYSIARSALEADLIINLPKPKTHRLAGMTGAMKNLVGIACKKETLPHRTSGDAASGGDSYRSRSFVKRMADRGLNLKTYYERDGKTGRAAFTWLWAGFFCLLSKKFAPDPYLMGSWYGNDTIWRTVADLNYLMLYADKRGVLRDVAQRKILSVADMIVAGQGEGPLRPSPKQAGVVLASDDPCAMDRCICKIMGFDERRIPLLAAMRRGDTAMGEASDVDVRFEGGGSRPLSATTFPDEMRFAPHSAWSEVLEGPVR